MNGHSQIVGPSTKHILNPVLRNYFRYGKLSDKKNWDTLLRDILRLFNADFSIWKIELSLDKLMTMATPGDLDSLLKQIFLAEAAIHNKNHVFIKENHIYEFFPYLLIKFQQAKYVYMVRDPRDMALSWKLNENLRGGVVVAARQWKKDQQNFLKMAPLLSEMGRFYFLKYEDLIEKPAQLIEEMLYFMELSYEHQMLSFYKDQLTIKNSRMNSAWANLGGEILSKNKNKYKLSLTDQELKAVEKICFYEMNHLKYYPETPLIDLERFSNTELLYLEGKENSELPYKPAKGVTNNMSAKAAMYQR
jgi:hypothetical protein